MIYYLKNYLNHTKVRLRNCIQKWLAFDQLMVEASCRLLYNKIRMLHKIKKIWSVVVLILMWSLLSEGNSGFVGLTIQTSSTQINLASTYTFTINRGYDPVNFQFISSPAPVPLNTVIIITLPSQFITITTSGTTLTCINPANSQSLTCNVNVAAKTITITDYYSTSATLSNSQVMITMYNLVNAYKAVASDNFFWQIVNPSGTVIDQGPPINNVIYPTSITFTAGVFQSCSISANGAYVSSDSPIILNIVPANPIPSTGQLIITLPTSWLADPLQTSTISTYPSCTGVTNTGSSVTCSYAALPDMQMITVSSLSSSSLSAQFSIRIANILIPPTVGSSQSISIYSQWSDGTQIDTCTSKITNMVVAPFQSATLQSNDNTAVQSSFTSTLALSLSRNFYYQDSIQLILPNDFLDAQISSTTFSSFTKSSNINTITLSSFPSNPQVIASGNSIKFILSGIFNPLSTEPISLTVGFFRNSQLYQQSVVSYSAVSTGVNSFSISADSNFVQNVGKATLTIVSTIKIPVNSSIYIVYPSTITSASVSSTSVIQAALNGSVVTGAKYQISNNQITFTSIFSSNFIGTVTIIIDKFSNPTTVQPSTYLLQIQDQNGYAVMYGSYSIVANTRPLISNTITASSYQALQTGVTYTASITTNFDFTSVAITIPTDITIGSGFQTTCAPSSFSSCSLSGNILTFTGTLSAGSYQLQWGYVSNPVSFKPTSSFQIYTYYRGFGVQNSQGVLSIAMNSTYPFSNFILYPSSYTNSANISVTLMLGFPTNTPAGQLSLLVPSELVITSASCSGCTISSPYIYITYSPAVSSATIVISNLVNVGSFKPVNSFIASLKSSEGYQSLYSTIPAWTNNQASSFTTQVVGNNNYKGESNNFKFQLAGLSNSQRYVIINIASSFGQLSTAPSGFTLVTSYALKVDCLGTACSFNFSITNPTISSNYSFAITSYTTDNYQVGTSTSNLWTFDCSTTNCRSCQSNGSCTSCYDSLIISNGYNIYNTFTSSCDRACQSGYFLINTTCSICDSNCSQCQNASKTCIGCTTGYFLETTYHLCVPTCQSGYFANSLGKTCSLCSQPCATCSSAALSCLSCVQNYYLYNNSCLSTCPLNYFIANVVTLQCDSCSSNCLTCNTTISNCLSCNNTLGLYFQNNVCVANCSSNYFLVNNICTYCSLPCKVCTRSITVCTSCYLDSSTPIYFKQYCISSGQCPIGYYVNTTNSSCQSCPVNCTQCTSPTVCSSCSLGYYVYGTLCLSSCPNTTYFTSNSSTGFCQPCNSCLTCNSSTVCTSCITSQYLYNAICYSICPNGSFPQGLVCVACASQCPTCQNSTFCTSCITSMYLYKGECYLYCPNTTFANTSGQICSSCPASCATCTSLTSCQTCITSYSLEDSQCVLVCSKGLSFNQVCYPCGLNCDICVNTTCSKCVNTYYLYNNTCVQQCPNNMLTLDSMNCILCTNKFINCSTCNVNQCLTCTYGQLSNGSCIPCSPGYYAESSACTPCPSSCSTCESQVLCTSCKSNNYLLNNMCSSSCPINMFPNGTTCSICLANCNICNQATSLCTVCQAGYYLYNNLCATTCPSPLVVSYDFVTCVTQAEYFEQFSKAAKIVPFPFTIVCMILVIVGVILKLLHKEMHLQTLLVALVGMIEIFCWLVFLGFQNIYYMNYHKLSLYSIIGAVIGVGILVLFNFIHLKFYYKYISEDQQFVKWVRKNSCSNKSILTFATLLTFKFYRLIYSKFLGREQTSMVLSSHNRLIPFSMISIISIFLCSIPVFIGCGLALYNSISQDQQFFIALDTITVTGLVIILMIMDLKHPDDYFVDEHEAKNLKKKVYQEQEIIFDQVFNNPLEDNVSREKLVQKQDQNEIVLQQDQGDMALPPSATKFKSTMYPDKTKQLLDESQSCGSDKNIIDEQSQQKVEDNKNKWQPKKYDHFGYLLKYDANNNQVKYDENGYRVQIDDKGVHRRYNQQGYQMKLVDGKWIPHDKDGFKLINGKRYNEKGYQIRDENGQHVPYDQYGFKVVGEGQNQRHIDENGYTIKIDKDGKIRRYQQDGWEVVEQNGKKLLKNKEGQYVRKNKNGQWQIYDPSDGFALKINPKTGKYDKYNDLGFRVIKDKYGDLHYYDEQGYKVTILPGNQIIRHDERGYRIEKDQNGQVHRFDEDGYELVQDQNGNFMFVDKNGYRVERDLYGRVTLYDKDNNEVKIDKTTGVHRKYNDEGLQVVTDLQGNKKLIDKRGRVVKQLDGTYEKYDADGNKIWLDENGYEIEQDEDGNVNRYDKVGDRVDTEYEINQSDDFDGNLMIQTTKKPLKYRYKHTKDADQEQQLNKLLSVHQPIEFEEQQQIQQLHEFHDNYFPKNEKDVDYQFDRLVNKQRSELLFKDQEIRGLQDLQQFEHQQQLYGHLVQPNLQSLDQMLAQNKDGNGRGLPNQHNLQRQFDNQLIIKVVEDQQPNQLKRQAEKGNNSLVNKQLNMQRQLDNQLSMRNLDQKQPHLLHRPINANHHLVDKQLNRQPQFDQEFAVNDLDAKQPELRNRSLQAHRGLRENESGMQMQYDKEALVKDIDQNEPDPIELKRRYQQKAEIARKKALNNNLKISRAQDQIQIKSVADISVDQRSFQNQGVHPLQNRTDFDEINSLDEIEVPLGRKQRGNRSELSLVNNKKNTQTVYNYNTVQVQIKNQNNLYDQDEDIQSLHEEDWQEQMNPMMFPKRQRVKDESQRNNNSNANTNILYIEDEQQDKDALSELVHQSQSKSKIKPNPNSNSRYHKMNDILSREVQSIQQIEEKLFREANHKQEIRERREFRLSGAPNPLVEYAKTIQANKKSLQEKMYLDHNYKK